MFHQLDFILIRYIYVIEFEAWLRFRKIRKNLCSVLFDPCKNTRALIQEKYLLDQQTFEKKFYQGSSTNHVDWFFVDPPPPKRGPIYQHKLDYFSKFPSSPSPLAVVHMVCKWPLIQKYNIVAHIKILIFYVLCKSFLVMAK